MAATALSAILQSTALLCGPFILEQLMQSSKVPHCHSTWALGKKLRSALPFMRILKLIFCTISQLKATFSWSK